MLTLKRLQITMQDVQPKSIVLLSCVSMQVIGLVVNLPTSTREGVYCTAAGDREDVVKLQRISSPDWLTLSMLWGLDGDCLYVSMAIIVEVCPGILAKHWG